MASDVTRVVLRCECAQETGELDLSECQLMQVPDAVYHLMRHTTLKGCNLSSNVITKIPPKFAVKFSLITDLNLSHNQMSKLPDELSDLAELARLDISHNAYIALPRVVFKIPKLARLRANNNHIVDVEVERLQDAPSLEEVDLQENPVSPRCHDALTAVSSPRVLLSARALEDWEDLAV
ncbi:leucine-rich repeat protein SHOC-2 isoform X1 [Bacillus rossius redtenbacheri]|uniref:leucine-rich repeat protein SHOC-2 isoform X1 n=1 Tax=Bacillus rossius redtenbacheri TaxID=93214 RepID=UPI002FDE6C8A